VRWNHKNPTKRIGQVQGGHHNVHCSHHDIAENNAQLALNNNHQSLIHLCQVKIPKRKSKVVNRRTDNTTDKRNGTKGQTIIYRKLHRKQKIERHQPHRTPWSNQVLRRC
jgi:hypothetical protein